MSYTLNQKLNQVSEGGEAEKEILNQWTNKISTDNMPGHFIAVVSNETASGDSQRVITVKLMDLEGVPAETVVDTGVFVRQPEETSVKVILLDQAGEEVASCLMDYTNGYSPTT